MLKRVLIAVGFLGFMNFYVLVRLIGRSDWAGMHVGLSCLLAFGFFALQLAAPFGDRLLFPQLKTRYGVGSLVALIDWLSYAALGILSCAVFYTLLLDIVTIGWIVVMRPTTLETFDHYALLVLLVGTALTALAGIGQAAAGPKIRRVEIPLRNLPAAFDGFKIVQISDLHVSAMIKRDYTENVVRLANSLSPDLIAMTGDFIDGSVADLREDVAPLTALAAPLGKFFVTGNHEYYWNAPAWTEEFTRLGAQVLTNQHQLIERDGQQIIIAGITDYSARHMIPEQASDPRKALVGAPLDRVKILLAHQPASYTQAQEAGYDLQLSGHTHAGQYFPFTLLIGFFQRYYKGLNRHKDMWIYVNCGTGFWGPPLRAGAPSEITLITLRPAV